MTMTMTIMTTLSKLSLLSLLSLAMIPSSSLPFVSSQPFSQYDEPPYLQHLNAINEASYAAVNDVNNPHVPPNLLSTCAKNHNDNDNAFTPPTNPASVTVTVTVTASTDKIITATDVSQQCSPIDICIIPSDVTLLMDSSLIVAALQVYGKVLWTDDTMDMNNNDMNSTDNNDNIFLCAGYVVMEGNDASFTMNIQHPTKYGWIYIQDNDEIHEQLRSRAFGAIYGGRINIIGRILERTWSLLSKPMYMGDDTIYLLHDPRLMKWNIGDRIAIAPTDPSSQGYAQEFIIVDIIIDDHHHELNGNGGMIRVDTPSKYNFKADFQAYDTTNAGADADAGTGTTNHKNVATMSAEVVNLSRNIIITGDDMTLVNAVENLPIAVPGEDHTSAMGCLKYSWRSKCTYGLHTILMYGGSMNVQNVRVEKCGQRGVAGKYCFHFHKVNNCNDNDNGGHGQVQVQQQQCVLKNNVAEYGTQRGIIVHGTHNAIIENNILYNVRGAGLYIEDGNEMYNKIRYNIIICPHPFDHGVYGGCTIPGTSNHIADTADNQAAFYSRSANNDMVGNRAVNSFNGMFLQALGMGRGSGNVGKVCEADARFGRFEGNVFHGHKRFGTYTLGSNYPKMTDQNHLNNGHNTNMELCTGFTEEGMTRGVTATFHNHLDYDSVFVGHYNAGDVQYQGHYSYNNHNLLYWKETKNMEDGCSAHITGGYYENGNVALPDQATFIIEDTSFKDAELEANHHCTVGITGVLCMPQYILHNVTFKKVGGRWLWFNNHPGDHSYTQPDGGIFSLSPPNAAIVMDGGGSLEHSLLPEGYVSVVSERFTYLLVHPNNVCVLSSAMSAELGTRYDNGILCMVPLRSLKIYSRNQLIGNNPLDLRVEAWFNNSSRNGAPNAAQNLRYHQIGGDNQSQKQGYSIPIIPGVENTYRLSMVNGQNVPNDWIIEFNDPVVGNRWGEEFITLEVQGRVCADNGLVSSQHDRRFIWSGDEFLNPGVWDSNGNAIHGACVAVGEQPPNMPMKICISNAQRNVLDSTMTTNTDISKAKNENVDGLEPTECPELCSPACNQNSYCDCGTAQCMCKAGFAGDACSTDLCAAARCSPNGVCAAKYLGPGTSGSLPITSENACICENGFSGILCDSNPCENVTCSGKGYCIAQGLEAKCVCDDGYSGDECETSCDDFCSGTFPYNCNPNLGSDIIKYGCNTGGGCMYLKEGEEYGDPSKWCTFKEIDTGGDCECSTMNQCQTIGSCNDDGTCPDPVFVTDGTPCNSVPWGICENGQCVASEGPTTYSPTSVPSVDPSPIPSSTVTAAPSSTPSSTETAVPTSEPSIMGTSTPSSNPSLIETAAPSSIPSQIEDCTDSPLKILLNVPKTCKSFSKKTKKFCKKTKIKFHCPKTCKVCDEYGSKDSIGTFIFKNNKRDCKWVLRDDTFISHNGLTRISNLCQNDSIKNTCRKTCSFFCTPE